MSPSQGKRDFCLTYATFSYNKATKFLSCFWNYVNWGQRKSGCFWQSVNEKSRKSQGKLIHILAMNPELHTLPGRDTLPQGTWWILRKAPPPKISILQPSPPWTIPVGVCWQSLCNLIVCIVHRLRVLNSMSASMNLSLKGKDKHLMKKTISQLVNVELVLNATFCNWKSVW